MALFTAIATWLVAGTFLAGSTFAIGAIAVGLAIGAEVAVSYAYKAITGHPDNPTNSPDSFGVQGKLTAGGDVPRAVPLGVCSTPGQLVYANYHGGDSQTPNAYLTWVIKLWDVPAGTLREVWVNGEKVTLQADTGNPIGQIVSEYVKDGSPYLWFKYYDGTQTTADPYCVSTVSSDDRPYESTRVGYGCAYIVATALINDTLYTGFPEFKFVTGGMKLYDPSKDDTAGGSGSHRFSDRTTWGGDGDDFPAVQIYNVLRGISYGGIWLYGLQNMTAARLPPENWITQVAKCRDPIVGEDGYEPTYRCGGQVNVNTQPINAITQCLTACQGRMSEIGGFYKLHIGEPDSPSFAFTDGDIISTEKQSYRPFFALADSVNGIQARYPDPSQGWNYVTAPAYYRTDLERKDGNRRLMATPSFDFVPYPSQVQRLQKSAIEEGQRARSHDIVLPPAFWIYEPGDVGEWTSDRNGYDAKQFRIDSEGDKANLNVSMTLTEVDPSDFDWDHSVDFTQVTSGPTGNVRPAAQGVVDWFAEAATLYDADGVGRRPAIRLAWDGTVPGVVGVQYEVRLTADHSDVTRGRTDQLAAGAIIFTQSLIPNTSYQVRGQYLPSAPRDMLWSDWLVVTTPDIRLSLADLEAGIVAQVTSITDALNDKIDFALQQIAALASNDMATTWLDKKEVKTEISAQFGNAYAAISTIATAQASTDAAFASFTTSVTASLGETNATVATYSAAIAMLNGYAAAAYSVTLDVNGYATGLALVNGGSGISTFTITADKFQIALPSAGVSGAAVPVFTVANVGGTAKVALRGDMIVDGAITATKMAVGSITAANGAIDALAVTSLNIQGNAVTVPVLQKYSSTFTAPATYASGAMDSFSFSVDTTGLSGHTLRFSYTAVFQALVQGGDSLGVRLFINGTANDTFLTSNVLGGGSAANFSLVGTGGYSWTASGGTDTFTIATQASSGLSSTISGRTYSLTAVKR